MRIRLSRCQRQAGPSCCQDVSLQPWQTVGPASSRPHLYAVSGRCSCLGRVAQSSSDPCVESLVVTAYVPAVIHLCTLWTPFLACPEAQTKALLEHEVLSTESCWLMLAGDLACVIVYLSPNRGAVFIELSAVVWVCCPRSFICSIHKQLQ